MGLLSWAKNKYESAEKAVSSKVNSAVSAVSNTVKSAKEWTGDRVDAIKENTGKIAEKVSNAASAAIDPQTYVDAAKSIGEKAGKVKDSIGNSLKKAVEGVKYAIDNPGEIAGKVGNALKTAAVETGKFTRQMATNPVRTLQLTGQATWNAAAGTVCSVVDLGGMVLNHLPLRYAINGASEFVGLDKPWGKVGSLNTLVMENTQWVKPKDNYERVMLHGTQAVGEIGAFVVLTAVTAGGYAAVVGTARGARVASVAPKALKAAKTAGKWMAPTTKGEAALEAAFVAAAATGAVTSANNAAETINKLFQEAGQSINEQIAMNEKQMKAAWENKNTSSAEINRLLDKHSELLAAKEELKEIRQQDEIAIEDLRAKYVAVSGISSKYTRRDSEITAPFTQSAEGIAAINPTNTPAAAPATIKQEMEVKV